MVEPFEETAAADLPFAAASLTAWPNPLHGSTTLRFSSTAAAGAIVEVFNLAG